MAYTKEELRNFMLKEIEIIQDIIKRMASNSFMIKGWTVTLVVVTLLLRGSKHQVLIAFIPILVFWFLDAYFLWQERLYRRLYNWVIKNRMNTDEYLFVVDMKNDRGERFKREEQSKLKIMFSITLRWFYGSLFILTLIYAIYVFLQKGGC